MLLVLGHFNEVEICFVETGLSIKVSPMVQDIGQHYIFYLAEEQRFQVAQCTVSHVGHIFLEPTIDCKVERFNGNGLVVALHILLLVVGEDLLHGCSTGPTGSWRYKDIQVAIHMENWGVLIDRIRQAVWWLQLQQWKPGDDGDEATEFVMGVQGSVEGEGPAL